MPWPIIVLLALSGAYIIYFTIRLLWIARSIDKLHTAICSKQVNDLAILYALGKHKRVPVYRFRYLNIEDLIKDCTGRIYRALLNPFTSWNMYTLLPTLDMAKKIFAAVRSGEAVTDTKEYLARTRELRAQIEEEEIFKMWEENEW
jgi:hypothetical protein